MLKNRNLENNQDLLVLWLKEQGGNESTFLRAFQNIPSDLKILVWFREQRCPWYEITICYSSGEGIKWLMKMVVPIILVFLTT